MPETVDSRTEALINELKGHLFEYLTADELSKLFSMEGDFLRGVSRESLERLKKYQQQLRHRDSELFYALPSLAQETALEIAGKPRRHIQFSPQNILLCGLSPTAATGATSRNEGDIVLMGAGGESLPISLKLCKEGAFVNTKSGGVRSFLSTYFDNQGAQAALNARLESSFHIFSHQMHEMAGLSYSGKWNNQWHSEELPHLPGQLSGEQYREQKEALSAHYKRVIDELYLQIKKLAEESPQNFSTSLAPLLGFAGDDVLQVTCFHNSVGDARYRKGEIFILQGVQLEREQPIISPPSKNSSFNILLSELILQIRVKPMNTFTVPALKINCSIKRRNLQ